MAVAKKVAVKAAPAKAKAERKPKAETILCEDCNGSGLQDANTLCPSCEGHGKV